MSQAKVGLASLALALMPRYGSFVDYGDGDAYRHELEQLREEARSTEQV